MFVITGSILQLLNDFRSSEPVAYLSDSDLAILSYLTVLHEDDEALYSCYTVALSTSFCYAYIVFFALFNRFWTRIETSVKTRTLHPLLAIRRYYLI